ncbi:MAG: GH116 family glycosyl hydrolase [Candidatus Omnitrophota bacterium]
MNYRVRPEATIGVYGDIATDRKSYRPLDPASIYITGRDRQDDKCTVRVCDSQLQFYFEAEVVLVYNHGKVNFAVAGNLGTHWLYLYFPDSSSHSRYVNFWVDCETAVETGSDAYDSLYPVTKESILLGRRSFVTDAGRFVGYISADTWTIDGVWLRDWIYQLSAYCYWEREMTCGLDRFIDVMGPDGKIPDGIRRDGTTWRMAVESDIEYIFVLGVYGTWKATGDSEWLKRVLPAAEKALSYVRNDDLRWDADHQLVKRGHTCDTWDFEIHEGSGFVGKRAVIANCDQSGYYLAFKAMAEMYCSLENGKKADEFNRISQEYRRRANDLLWDGTKYLHHVHLTPIDHDGFDETQQLTMGNTWAITRGLADHEQAVSIIKEYRKRHKETGDAYPWWSLQPGYPDELDYYEGEYCKQGGYANGGLMPWVGGELCLGAFENGMEAYGLELYHQYIDHLRRTGNRVYMWYWPDGQAGFRTTNEVPYAGWGMSQWLSALIEGLAGVRDEKGQMNAIKVSPRWAATDRTDVRVFARYAAAETYFAYHIYINAGQKNILMEYCGSGRFVDLHVLLPGKCQVESVMIDNQPVEFREENIEESVYVNFSSVVGGKHTVKIYWKQT